MRNDTKIAILIAILTPISFYGYLNTKINSEPSPSYFAFTLNNKISAFYQSFKSPNTANQVLKSFRRFYPFSEIILVDAGTNPIPLQNLADKYNAKYMHIPESFANDSTFFSTFDAAHTYISRILNATGNCDWLLLLEDNVFILGQIPLHEFRYVVNAGNVAMILDSVLIKAITDARANQTDSHNWQYTGNAGTVLRCSFYRDLRDTDNWNSSLSRIYTAKPKIDSAELLSAFTYLTGGTIGFFESYAERSFASYLYQFVTGALSSPDSPKYLYDARDESVISNE